MTIPFVLWGTAHTIKRFGIVNRYDLTREFPVITLRRTAFKSAVDELLWIWQKKSNNIHHLNSHIWDSWADEDGSIGKAYGYQLGVKHHYKEGDFDQVDRILYDLKHNPLSRRIMSNIYNHHDLCEMNLYPCAYSMTFNVSAGAALAGRKTEYDLIGVYKGELLINMDSQAPNKAAWEWLTALGENRGGSRIFFALICSIPVSSSLTSAKS